MGAFDKAAQAAKDLGLEKVADRLKKMKRPEIKEIQNAAKEFCNRYKDAEQIYEQRLKAKELKRGTALKYKAKTNLREQTQLEYGVREAFDKFQFLINLYFDQVMLLMYVYMDPETGAVTLGATEDNPKYLKRSDYGSIQYYLENIRKDMLVKFKDYDSTYLDITEQSIYKRLGIAKQRAKDDKGPFPILWYLNGQWEGAWVNNLGTIAEAYVNFYLSKYKFTQILEQDVRIYILDKNLGAVTVDNASGFLIGDSSYNGLHFAVKKQSATPMRLKTVYEEVNKLLQATGLNEAGLNDLATIFIENEGDKKKGSQAGSLSGNIEKTYDRLIQDYKDQEIVSGLIL